MKSPQPQSFRASFRNDERGAAVLEFAMIFSGVLLLMVGVTDYSFAIHQAMIVQQAAVAGARYGAIPGNEGNTTGMEAAATSAAAGVSGFSVTATNLWTCTPGGASVSSTTRCASSVNWPTITPYKYVVVKTSASVPKPLSVPGISSNGTVYGAAIFRVPWSQ